MLMERYRAQVTTAEASWEPESGRASWQEEPQLVEYPGLICESIARLSDRELRAMAADELVQLIQMSPVVARDADGFRRLPWMSDRELLRIASLVRRCCRTRMNAYQRSRGQTAQWHDAC